MYIHVHTYGAQPNSIQFEHQRRRGMDGSTHFLSRGTPCSCQLLEQYSGVCGGGGRGGARGGVRIWRMGWVGEYSQAQEQETEGMKEEGGWEGEIMGVLLGERSVSEVSRARTSDTRMNVPFTLATT
jgi:hypothetical protein